MHAAVAECVRVAGMDSIREVIAPEDRGGADPLTDAPAPTAQQT